MKDLSEIRCDIDAIDRQIVSLYEQRMGLAAEVAEYKIANHKNVYDKAREDEKLKTLAQLVPDEFLKQGVVELFEQIHVNKPEKTVPDVGRMRTIEPLEFRELEKIDIRNKRIVFQGVEGAYAQMAMKQFFGENCRGEAVVTWRDAMGSHSKWQGRLCCSSY